MFIDASALCSMIAREHDADALLDRLYGAPRRSTSALAIWESTVAVARVLGIRSEEAEAAVLKFIEATAIDVVDVTAQIAPMALDAHRRYGKGRHKAALNFGDCFAYACARHYKMPLLYKGNDFVLTDIDAA